MTAAGRPLLVALGATLAITVAARALPDAYVSIAVWLVFVGATWWLVLRDDEVLEIRAHGLSLGGVLEPEPLDARRIVREATTALAWAGVVLLVVFPPFVLGWKAWWHPSGHFAAAPLALLAAEVPGQILVVALPEEAFYRGYLQTRLDRVWSTRWQLLGAPVGPGLVVTSAIFAIGHLATEAQPARLAVFFPSLLFGWLRARSGGIGAGLVVHAASNLLTFYLARSWFG